MVHEELKSQSYSAWSKPHHHVSRVRHLSQPVFRLQAALEVDLELTGFQNKPISFKPNIDVLLVYHDLIDANIAQEIHVNEVHVI